MRYDYDKIDDMVLALMCLTLHDQAYGTARAWKGVDWDVLDRLDEKGWILAPTNKAKAVVLTEAGLARQTALRAVFSKAHAVA
jgi:Domain of unknown function (DUF6429)